MRKGGQQGCRYYKAYRRNAFGNTVNRIWFVRNVVLCNIFKVGIFNTCRCGNVGNNGTSAYYENNRRGTSCSIRSHIARQASESVQASLELCLKLFFRRQCRVYCQALSLQSERIVGETAALIYTAGTVAEVSKGLLSSGRTLAIHMYVLSSEGLYTNQAYATAVVLLIFVLIINFMSSLVAKKFAAKD